MDNELRKKADWLKASHTGASVKDKGFGKTLFKCNPREFELAVLLESLIHIFAPKPLAVMRRQFNALFLWPVSQAVLHKDIEVKDVFSLGSTRSARQLTAVAHTPASRMARGLGIQTESSGNSHATRYQRSPYGAPKFTASKIPYPVACSH